MSISVIIHTYNSEKYLRECLESVKQADEVIVCDMYSTDKTIEIANEFGCKILYYENVGYADPARNWAMSQASSDYVFVVDSDEIIPQALWDYLRKWEKKEKPVTDVGMSFTRKNIVLGKVLYSWYPNRIQRFWKKGCVDWPANVHETPSTLNGGNHDIPKERKDLAIIHYNYDSIESFISRMNKYTTLEISKMVERGKKFSIAYLIFRPIGEFLKKYFLKQGYKEGMHGFIFSIYLAIYEFVEISKLWEYELNKNK